MTDTLPFPARHTDPWTSHEAAHVDRSTLTAAVRDALSAHPDGLTDWELVAVLGVPERLKGSVAKRRQDVGAVPVIGLSGRALSRPGRMGSNCIVWRLP